MNRVKVTPPNISKETMREMHQFFLKTSIPRILTENGEIKKIKNYNLIYLQL